MLNAFGEYYQLISGNRNSPVETPAAAPTSVPNTASPRPRPLPQRATQPNLPISPTPAPAVQQTPQASTLAKEVNLAASATPQWTAKGASPKPLPYRYSAVSSPQPASAFYQPSTLQASAKPSVLAKEVVTTPTATTGRIIPGQPTVPLAYGNPVAQPDTTKPFKFPVATQRTNEQTIDLRDVTDSELLYAVQLIAMERNLDLSANPYRQLPYTISKIAEANLNKYQIRSLRTAADAKAAQSRAKALGFNDAMIVVYLNGQRLPAKSVKYLLTR
ncbi:MAG: hypothetical protein AAF597_11970 [Bacteroidota bacterium]